jgi:hypothetical protein
MERLPITTIWERLGLPGRVSGNCVVRSPLSDDDRYSPLLHLCHGRRAVVALEKFRVC